MRVLEIFRQSFFAEANVERLREELRVITEQVNPSPRAELTTDVFRFLLSNEFKSY